MAGPISDFVSIECFLQGESMTANALEGTQDLRRFLFALGIPVYLSGGVEPAFWEMLRVLEPMTCGL